MLNMKPLALPGAALISPTRFEDDRGYFEEAYNARSFADAIGWEIEFVQDNESRSNDVGTIRGLHYQVAPSPQAKLIRVVSGAILDVIVDLRQSSDTYLEHLAVELDATNGQQLWVPAGLAHGFCTLEPMTVIQYKVTEFYEPSCDRAVLWSDPRLGIEWPVAADRAVLSAKDSAAPTVDQAEEAGDVFA